VLGVDAATGKVDWKTLLGRGATPPAYKASVAMAHDGTIYVSSPVTDRLYALNGKTGAVIWNSAIPYPQIPGLGRGAVTYDNGMLYQSTGTRLLAWNAKTGKLDHTLRLGGRFGIVNPVIVGNTMFVANSWGWVFAEPLTRVDGHTS
jgi:outer membrane protein assembly factor BamB